MALKVVTNSMSKAFIAFLRANMPSVEQGFDDFPNPSQALKYPAFSLLTKSPVYSPLMPYVISKGDIDDDTGLAPVRRVVGEMDFTFQLDLWADSKPARQALFEEFLAAMTMNVNVNGVSLQLTDYYNTWARFDFSNIRFIDDEMASQRTEWRVMAEILGNVRVIDERNEKLIGTIENTLETPEEIPPPDVPAGNQII